MIRYLLFDIDDTLLNFRDCVDPVIRRALADVGLTFDDAQFAAYHRINGGLWEQVAAGTLTQKQLYATRWTRVLEALGLDADGPTVEARFRHHLHDSSVPEEGAAETLAYLAERYTLATASNAPQRQQEQRLEAAGLAKYFTRILTSDLVGYDKPAPAFFDAVLRELGDPPRDEVMMLGDSVNADIRGAQNAGLAACLVNTRHADPATLAPGTRVVNSLPELMTLL